LHFDYAPLFGRQKELIEMISETKPALKKKDVSAIELLYQYRKDIDNWPQDWEIAKEDLIVGEAIKEQFKLFLINSIEQGRAKRTIKRYAVYLWVLGGELIRRINEDESERSLSGNDLILTYVDDSGGPYWRHARDEVEHDEYDAVCRKFFKFITQNSE
jgi:hypothetical protein